MTEHGGPPQQPEQQPDPFGRPPHQPPYQGEPQPGQPYPGQAPQQPGQPYPGQPYPGPPFAQGEQPYPPGPPQGQPPFGPGQPMPLGQPFPPPAAKKRAGIKALVIGGITVVVLGAGCCIGGNLLLGDKDDDNAAGGGRGGDKAVSAAEYATVLSEVDTSLKAPFAALSGGDKAAFATAAQGLRDGSQRLTALDVPSATEVPHQELAGSMLGFADVVEQAGTEKAACPAGSPAATVFASDEAGLVREDAKELATSDPALVFGSFLPAAPKEQTRQLKNGTFVKKGPGGGRGVLEIKNGADGDTTVSLVGKDAKKPVFTVYVRGGGNYTVKNIKPGKYEIYTASGEDWDAGKKGFTRKCGFSKFDDKFDYDSSGSGWTITLQQVIGGNASTTDVDPGSFPTD